MHRTRRPRSQKKPPRDEEQEGRQESDPGRVIDPYLPANGNFGYRVSRYELDLEYKVAINRLSGSATITAVDAGGAAHASPWTCPMRSR